MARLLIAVGGVLLAVGLVLGGTQALHRYQTAVERQQVDAYTASVLPPARDAGRLVGQTIAPELQAYETGQVPGAKIAADAESWHTFFVSTRAAFARTSHTDRLAAIAGGFDTSLAEYATAVQFFGRLDDAGAAPAALAAGLAAAGAADRNYCEAENSLAGLRQSLGLQALPEFRARASCPAG